MFKKNNQTPNMFKHS